MCGIAFLASLQHPPCEACGVCGASTGPSPPAPDYSLPTGTSPTVCAYSGTSPAAYNDTPPAAYSDESGSRHSCSDGIPAWSLNAPSELKPTHPHTDESMSHTDFSLSHTDEPLLSSKDKPLSDTDEPLSHTDESLQRMSEALKRAISRRGPDSQSSLHRRHATCPTAPSGPPSAPSSQAAVGAQLHSPSPPPPSRGGTPGVHHGVPPLVSMEFLGSVLQLRGEEAVRQPLQDSGGNVLLFNGEIFGGLDVPEGANDGMALLRALGQCCTCHAHTAPTVSPPLRANPCGHAHSAPGVCHPCGHVHSVPEVSPQCDGCAAGTSLCPPCGHTHSVPGVLSRLRGPWAVVFWQPGARLLWYGRDFLGRRSLLRGFQKSSRSSTRGSFAGASCTEGEAGGAGEGGGGSCVRVPVVLSSCAPAQPFLPATGTGMGSAGTNQGAERSGQEEAAEVGGEAQTGAVCERIEAGTEGYAKGQDGTEGHAKGQGGSEGYAKGQVVGAAECSRGGWEWEEVECGIHSMSFHCQGVTEHDRLLENDSKNRGSNINTSANNCSSSSSRISAATACPGHIACGTPREHPWEDEAVRRLARWERPRASGAPGESQAHPSRAPGEDVLRAGVPGGGAPGEGAPGEGAPGQDVLGEGVSGECASGGGEQGACPAGEGVPGERVLGQSGMPGAPSPASPAASQLLVALSESVRKRAMLVNRAAAAPARLRCTGAPPWQPGPPAQPASPGCARAGGGNGTLDPGCTRNVPLDPGCTKDAAVNPGYARDIPLDPGCARDAPGGEPLDPGCARGGEGGAPLVGVLFSGGLDSMVLAALAHRHVPAACPIELLNVSFDGERAPDRQTAHQGLRELHRVNPHRRWRLVEVDASLADVDAHRDHLLSLIHPLHTHMDLNIGAALWLAAGGRGRVLELGGHPRCTGAGACCEPAVVQAQGCTGAPVLLVGSGADEQCGGYARYRTKFKAGGWSALEDEMRGDMRRLWTRNLGRDDRCIADQGREARFPFLDEDVMQLLLDLPLPCVVDLTLEPGVGDKKILRQVARLLGLKDCASLPKRAIQFGSRIAKESNMKHFGSNRAANRRNVGGLAL